MPVPVCEHVLCCAVCSWGFPAPLWLRQLHLHRTVRPSLLSIPHFRSGQISPQDRSMGLTRQEHEAKAKPKHLPDTVENNPSLLFLSLTQCFYKLSPFFKGKLSTIAIFRWFIAFGATRSGGCANLWPRLGKPEKKFPNPVGTVYRMFISVG